MEKDYIFKTNPQKSANKVTINSFMMGSLFFVLTLIITLDPNKFSHAIIFQLFLAIPLLYISSLAYSKVGYWEQTADWDTLGWFTNTIGNLFVINAIGLLALKFSQGLAYVYFSMFCVLMTLYTLINIKQNKKILHEKIFKLIFLLVIIFFGGIIFIL
ncbi:MAG TPA: hypothetical protein VGO63_02205 [Candidatus Paceibacterota bacterium]|jgi:hypothetical protein|nr:hypothetical protein [Candidatus Paceibacterota bacterium]